MLLGPDYILQLMKQQVDDIVAQDQQVQVFLSWLSQKSHAVSVSYKPVTVRAFYFDLAFTRVLDFIGGTLELARSFNRALTCNLERSLALDLALDRILALDQVFDLTHKPILVFECVLERAIAHAHAVDPVLERSLQRLKHLPNLSGDKEKFKQWWSVYGKAWIEKSRVVIIEYRNIGHKWQFSSQQKEALKHYYDANKTLVNCLDSYSYVTNTVRQEIEKTLLLPIIEIPLPYIPEWN